MTSSVHINGGDFVEWFESLYDDFRQRTGFGSLPAERTQQDVDFIIEECRLERGSRVLDLCSGTGRHAIELTRRGLQVVGVELNPAYVELAQERAAEAGVTPSFRVGDVRTVEFGSGYDGAILMWNSFGFFEDEQERAFLARVSTALKPSGRFLVEVLNRDYLIRNFEARAEREIEGIAVVEERTFDVLGSRINSTVTRHEPGGIQRRVTRWRLYSPHELRILGEAAGFRFVVAHGTLNRQPVTLETRLMRFTFENRRS